jgi:hypothetical protein
MRAASHPSVGLVGPYLDQRDRAEELDHRAHLRALLSIEPGRGSGSGDPSDVAPPPSAILDGPRHDPAEAALRQMRHQVGPAQDDDEQFSSDTRLTTGQLVS